MLNEKEKQYCNYQPHLTGKDLKIAVFEAIAMQDRSKLQALNIQIPLYMNDIPLGYQGGYIFPHCLATCGIIRDMLPEAEIYLLPPTQDAVKWVIANKINIVNLSIDRLMADDSLEKIMSNRTLLICAGGNTDYSVQESTSAKLEFWNSVSACHLINGIPQFADYSSSGLGKLDFISFSNLEVPNFDYKLYGTSFSSPFLVGLVGQFYEMYYNVFGVYPYPDEALYHMQLNSTSIIDGTLKDGYGLFRLPNYETYYFGLMCQIDNNIINNNGVKKEYAPPKTIENIVDGKLLKSSYVPISLLREIGSNFTGKVFWHNDDKRIVVK